MVYWKFSNERSTFTWLCSPAVIGKFTIFTRTIWTQHYAYKPFNLLEYNLCPYVPLTFVWYTWLILHVNVTNNNYDEPMIWNMWYNWSIISSCDWFREKSTVEPPGGIATNYTYQWAISSHSPQTVHKFPPCHQPLPYPPTLYTDSLLWRSPITNPRTEIRIYL